MLTQPYNLQWKTNKENGVIPFLDIIVKPGTDGKLSITVYRKPDDTQQGPIFTVGQPPSSLSQIHCNLILLLIEPKLFVAILIFSKKKWSISRKALTHCKYPKLHFGQGGEWPYLAIQ